ncbi:MurJ-like flippase [Rosistilla carotiformis]|uniref:MurJ-like flippase n=1 Tax=Rosistilla carotiformis TaxID=2528017 RepID=A0A518JP00_9BACT|nr:oligosaccharide flippase family protein [Rosistilla carotiformis]QDV67248.1 MurJ-like flippase [Rosistilla carotiformis]
MESANHAAQSPVNESVTVREPFLADSLAVGLFVSLAMTVVQRGVGFARSVGFCKFLDEETLGQWAMALCFINLITPIFLLGLPGSIVRFVEYFRRRGQLQAFIYRIVFGTAVLTLLAATSMLVCPNRYAELIFRDANIVGPVFALAVCLVATIVFNFLEHLVSGLRQVRVASLMQFIHSVGFTFFAIGWLSIGGGVSGLILTFAAAAFLGCVPAAWVLLRNWSGLERSSEPLTDRSLARRIAPYAVSLWAINLIGNLFDLSDRYMILHFSVGGPSVGQAMVGEYFSSRLLPIFLLSLGTLIGGALMPYLTADWESGRRRRVNLRLRKTLLLLSGAFAFGSAVGMLLAPWMFNHLLDGRYTEALAVMPIAFVFCAWSGLIIVAENYLWCAEKGKLIGVALASGLLANIALNSVLLPMMGLYGAMLSTAIANLVVLLLVLYFMSTQGFVFDRSIGFALVLPATLLVGPYFALLAIVVVIATSSHTQRYLGQVLAEFRQHAVKVQSRLANSRFANLLAPRLDG